MTSLQAPSPVPQTQAPTSELPAVRADIIEAATRVFSRRGYHAASMTEIAHEVGMRKPSLYHHVRKKEDLLFAIHEQLIDELVEQTMAALASCESPAEKVRQVLRVSMAFIARRRDGVTVFLQERRAVSGERWSALVVKRDFYERMVSQVVTEGVVSGVFSDVPPAIAARGVLAMAYWGYTWFDPQGKLASDEVADIFADMALDGLLTR